MASAFVYVLITVLEIIVFSEIVGLGLNEWKGFIKEGITWVRELVNR